MAKKSKPEGKKYSYMDTYGDLVTLLLCFFVLLFAMSTVEENKFNAFVQAMTDRFGSNEALISNAVSTSGTGLSDDPPTGETTEVDPTLPADLSNMQQAIEEYIEENNMQGQVTVEGVSGTVYLRLSSSMLFDGNSAFLRPEIRAFLDFIGAKFVEMQDNIRWIKFNGHTATVAGSSVDDWELSGARSAVVASYFANTVGFDRFKLKTEGYGRNFPVADNGTVEGRAQNRRVDIIVIGNEDVSLEEAVAAMMNGYFPTDDPRYYEGNPDELPDEALGDAIPPNAETGLSDADMRAIYEDMQRRLGDSE